MIRGKNKRYCERRRNVMKKLDVLSALTLIVTIGGIALNILGGFVDDKKMERLVDERVQLALTNLQNKE